MHAELSRFIRHMFKINASEWANESYELSSFETFQMDFLQEFFQNLTLHHKLFYSIEEEHPFYPFEVYLDQTLVALGYMIDDKQHITYLNLNVALPSEP